MRHSPDMTTLTYSKHRAEHVTSGPMMCTMVHTMLAPRKSESPCRHLEEQGRDKVGIEIGQLDDGGSNGDKHMSIVAIC